MAGRGAPTYLKRQKEQNRAARANAKRAARQARRDERAAGIVKEDEDVLSAALPEQEAGEAGEPPPPGDAKAD